MGPLIDLSMAFLIFLQRIMIGNGFNLSPAPNYTFKQPSLKTFISPTRSAYFGYSVNLRKTGVLVGAARAQSDVEYQRNVNETGAVYRCSFTSTTTQCRPFHLDKQGNSNYEYPYTNHHEIRSEKKDNQMLGATVDGLGSDDAWLVACAPKSMGVLSESYLLHGICYLTEGASATADPKMVYKIKPLRIKAHQHYVGPSEQAYNYMFGELGFSVHVTDDGKEVLIGAPGVMGWRGTVVRYRQLRFAVDQPTGWNNVYRERHTAKFATHETVVPNPLYSGLKQYSYFGYTVSSGMFLGTRKLLYVAGAPQSRDQHGEVIIFDFAENRTLKETVMTRYRSFVGQQFGEYFGYSLLVEDFNSDGLPDLAVGAPMHSQMMEYDNGAVYVYLNGGELAFDLQIKLSSTYELSGRFGTSLAKIGDCNRDGYGDIAIGAPFEGRGAVYIFLGSANGLQAKPSQRLIPPTNNPLAPPTQPMFGHAISRGVDIDGNGYNDLAIGAPNDDSVYVYRTYPIVRVEARINSTRRELLAEGGTFEIATCWSADFPAGTPFNVTLRYSVTVDEHMGRAMVSKQTTSDSNSEVVLVGGGLVCKHFLVTVMASPTTLHKPVTVDVEYGMAERASPPQDGNFCGHCAILDPNDINRVHERIPFRTGCSTETCVSDLKIISIVWTDIASPYVIGSTKVATLEVEIENSGENAYLPQVNITVPLSLRLVKLMPECQLSAPVDGHMAVLCDLNNRLPILSTARIKFALAFDMTQLEGNRNALTIRAESLTSSKEQWPTDNKMVHTLLLHEFSQIDILSKSTPQTVNLEQEKRVINGTHHVKINNNGPSTLRSFVVHLDVPLAYTSAGANRCQVIKLKDLRVASSYNDTALEIDWVRANDDATFFKQTFSFYSKTQTEKIPPEESADMPPNNYSFPLRTTKPEWQFHVNDPADDLFELDVARQKRSSLWVAPARQSFSSILLKDLPPNRTVFFNCAQNDTRVECLQLQARLPAFPAGQKPILLELKYKLDLDAIAACLQEQEDIFVLQLVSDLEKPDNDLNEAFVVARNHPHTVVYRDASSSTPIWIYVTSSFGGFLLLAVISYTMHRRGFFERHLRQELKKFHRESTSFNDPDDLKGDDEEL